MTLMEEPSEPIARARRPARPSGRSSAMRCRSTATTSWCRRRTRGAVRLHGRVTDGAGVGSRRAAGDLAGRPDGAVVQQAGSLRRDGWTFTGWGRASTDADGRYLFTTLRPGATERGPAPFFAVTVSPAAC